MKAIRQLKEDTPVVIEDVSDPTLKDFDVLVSMEAAGVLSYHEDVLAGRLNYALPPQPFTPGNDGVGIVEKVGSTVLHLSVGDRVAIDPRIFANENVTEPEGMLLALTGLTPEASRIQQIWRDGTWAEKVAVPADSVTKLPEIKGMNGVGLSRLHKFAVCYGGLSRGQLAGGETVIVLGATGNFGSPAVPLAIAMGASRVIALGRNESVLEKLGHLSPRVIPFKLSGDPLADTLAIRKVVPGGVDLGLDLIGQAKDSTGIQAVIGGLRRGGRVVIQGSMDVPLELPYGSVMARDISIIGAFMYPRSTFRKLSALVECGALDLDCIEVESYSLDDVHAAMKRASEVRGLSHIVLTP
jgi:alcohol dehydrogenase